MSNYLRQLWHFFDGNKTKIGASLVLISKVALAWGAPVEVVTGLEQTGNLVATLGLAHAVTKSLDKPIQ